MPRARLHPVQSPRHQVLRAPAKLTLSLSLTGHREDGYHTIDAVMVSLDLADELVVDPDGHGVRLVIDGETHVAGADDLVVRALAAVGRDVGVTVHKRIPMGAGLGGGSSDAAAILRWAGCSDIAVALELGADVPFCLTGGRARVRGIGEIIDPLPFEDRTLTLLTPPIHCSTPAVYGTWDSLGGPKGSSGNDLEPAAIALYPELTRWRDELAVATGGQVRLAGSGSTWFVDGSFPGGQRVVTATIPAEA